MAPPRPTSYVLLAGFAAAAALTALAAVFGGAEHPTVVLVAFAVLAAVVAACARLIAAPAAGSLAWLFFDSFFVGHHADLLWRGSADGWRLALLVLAGLAGGASAALARRRGGMPGPHAPRESPEGLTASALPRPLAHGLLGRELAASQHPSAQVVALPHRDGWRRREQRAQGM